LTSSICQSCQWGVIVSRHCNRRLMLQNEASSPSTLAFHWPYNSFITTDWLLPPLPSASLTVSRDVIHRTYSKLLLDLPPSINHYITWQRCWVRCAEFRTFHHSRIQKLWSTGRFIDCVNAFQSSPFALRKHSTVAKIPIIRNEIWPIRRRQLHAYCNMYLSYHGTHQHETLLLLSVGRVFVRRCEFYSAIRPTIICLSLCVFSFLSSITHWSSLIISVAAFVVLDFLLLFSLWIGCSSNNDKLGLIYAHRSVSTTVHVWQHLQKGWWRCSSVK
jgi:hypothetical protein